MAIDLTERTYKVELTLLLSGHEKVTYHYINAKDAEDASYQALVDESHCEVLNKEDFLNGIHWDDDGDIYQVTNVWLVQQREVLQHIRG